MLEFGIIYLHAFQSQSEVCQSPHKNIQNAITQVFPFRLLCCKLERKCRRRRTSFQLRRRARQFNGVHFPRGGGGVSFPKWPLCVCARTHAHTHTWTWLTRSTRDACKKCQTDLNPVKHRCAGNQMHLNFREFIQVQGLQQ